MMRINLKAAVVAAILTTVCGTAVAGPYPRATLDKMAEETKAQISAVEARIIAIKAEISKIEAMLSTKPDNTTDSVPGFAKPNFALAQRLADLRHEMSKLQDQYYDLNLRLEWILEQIRIDEEQNSGGALKKSSGDVVVTAGSTVVATTSKLGTSTVQYRKPIADVARPSLKKSSGTTN